MILVRGRQRLAELFLAEIATAIRLVSSNYGISSGRARTTINERSLKLRVRSVTRPRVVLQDSISMDGAGDGVRDSASSAYVKSTR